MKYEFKKIDDDTTKLSYRDKEFEIKRDVELQTKVEDIKHQAKMKMIFDLSKMGKTKKDLVIERKEGNKTYYDNTNYIDLEQEYLGIAFMEYLNEVCIKYFEMDIEKLFLDIGINTTEYGLQEQEQFMKDLLEALSGKITPREETK